MRISSPPFLNPCFFGTDISSRDNLIACHYTTDEIRQKIGADTLGYLSMDGIKSIAKDSTIDFCYACFDGKYPIDVPDSKEVSKYDLKKSKQ